MNKNDINVRRASYNIVTAVMNDGQFLNDALNDYLNKYQHIDKNRRSFISHLTRGVIERCIELDAIISAYSSTKFNKLNPNIINILRLAIYEIKYMDFVPESATVNEYVKLASKVAPVRLKGFVNAILRSMIRDNFKKVSLKPNEEVSLPKWLYDRLESEYGDATAIGQAFLSKRSLIIRTNLTKCTPSKLQEILKSEGVTATPVESIDYAFAIEGVDYLNNLDSFKQGLFYVQDISSMMVGVKSNVKATDTVIDVCAAPGGKSLHIAELMTLDSEDNSIGCVMSYDISEDKVNLIRDNIKRTGLSNITAEVQDATKLNAHLTEIADIVIADLPCSGIGVIGGKPDIKLRITADDIESLSRLQLSILGNVKRYAKVGGKIIYSTCTVSKQENEDNIIRFLKDNHNYTLIQQTQYIPDGMQDGFYIAILNKEASDE